MVLWGKLQENLFFKLPKLPKNPDLRGIVSKVLNLPMDPLSQTSSSSWEMFTVHALWQKNNETR